MRKYLILIIISFVNPFLTFSQEKNRSYLYNYKAQLRIDTSLTITKNQYKVWSMVESNLLTYMTKEIDYPTFAKETNIKGIIIVAFDCDTSEIRNIRLLNQIGGGIDEAVLVGVKKLKPRILQQFKSTYLWTHKKKVRYDYLGTYYIPFDFTFIYLQEYMKEKHTFPIIDIGPLPLRTWIE